MCGSGWLGMKETFSPWDFLASHQEMLSYSHPYKTAAKIKCYLLRAAIVLHESISALNRPALHHQLSTHPPTHYLAIQSYSNLPFIDSLIHSFITET